MTGKKITVASGKIRNNYQNNSTNQLVSANKNIMKQTTSSAVISNSTPTNLYSYPPVTITSTFLSCATPNMSTLIKTSENIKYLPRFTASLSKPADELFPAEELDGIQLELEILLSTIALRFRSLKYDFDSLEREDKNQKKFEKIEKHASTTPVKRKRDDSSKKTAKETKTSQSAKLIKVKANSSDSPAHSQHTDDSMDSLPTQQNIQSFTIGQQNPKLLVPKNDIPNKFWLSVEPYCMPITQEDVKLLDDLIEEYSGPLVPAIPELGPHYATRWAAEDLNEEQDNSNPNSKANKRFTSAANPEVIKMLKKGEKLSSEKTFAEGITGPLTQRLVAALLEENLLNSKSGEFISSSDGISSMTNEINDCCGKKNPLAANRNHPIVSLLKNGIDVEIRLKKELIELGILDMSDFPKERDDEVLNEIKRVRTELESIAEYNLNELKQLRIAAKEEMKRLEIKRKLDAIDQELIESYKTVMAAKQKRRPLTKQEKNEIYRLIEEQKRLGDQLEAMPSPASIKPLAKANNTI